MRKTGFFHLIRHTSIISVKVVPTAALGFVLMAAGSGAVMAAAVYFKQYFFDQAEALAGGDRVWPVMAAGIVMGVFIICGIVMDNMREVLAMNYRKAVQGALGNRLISKASGMSALDFENSSMLDFINKAHKGIEGAADVIAGVLSTVLTQGFYFLVLGIYLYRIQPALLFMLLLSFVPSMIGTVVRYKVYAGLEDEVAVYRRRKEHYGRCIYDREFARETRMLGAFRYFYGLYKESLSKETEMNWKVTRKTALVEIWLRVAMLSGYAGTLILLFVYLMNGTIRIGVFAAVFSSMDQMFGQIDEIFNWRISEISQSMGPAQNYLKFMAVDERKYKEELQAFHGNIVLDQVNFTYPGRTRKALQQVSLEIKKGETVAVVGENGSGKSTLVRMMTGIYLPDEGTVKMDNRETRGLKPSSMYQHISAVFQKFVRYKMTLADNVVIATSDADGERVEQALVRADLDVDGRSFPEGLDTMLGKDFGGVDISGGQWQRLSIARGFYRPHSFIVLDEPTAAIDPLEEKRIYEKFMEIARDKTAVIVTHRLGSVKIADRIIVMDHGWVAGTGTHDALMDSCDKYREMYDAQAKWYQ